MDFSRNWLFIPASLQDKLAHAKVLVAGLGIGSVFAETAVRSGICHLTIADGDSVAASNLNRQNYVAADISGSKAAACARRLRAINPSLNLQVVEEFLKGDTLVALIKDCDFVVNTVDFDAPEFQDISQSCQEQRKIELFPINLGFGASLTLIDHSSPTWREVFPIRAGQSLKSQILAHIAGASEIQPYLADAAGVYFHQASQNPSYDSQLAVSCQISACMMVTTIIRLLANEPLLRFPYFYYLDTYAQLALGAREQQFRSIA